MSALPGALIQCCGSSRQPAFSLLSARCSRVVEMRLACSQKLAVATLLPVVDAEQMDPPSQGSGPTRTALDEDLRTHLPELG